MVSLCEGHVHCHYHLVQYAWHGLSVDANYAIEPLIGPCRYSLLCRLALWDNLECCWACFPHTDASMARQTAVCLLQAGCHLPILTLFLCSAGFL